jgi:hypothetical protein
MTWQPIETAPTNKQIIVLTCKGVAVPTAYKGKLWFVCFSMNDLDHPSEWIQATHWMPLPQAPKETQQ